jgi:hypothetical protein
MLRITWNGIALHGGPLPGYPTMTSKGVMAGLDPASHAACQLGPPCSSAVVTMIVELPSYASPRSRAENVKQRAVETSIRGSEPLTGGKVCFWRLADMPQWPTDVRFRG